MIPGRLTIIQENENEEQTLMNKDIKKSLKIASDLQVDAFI